MLTTSSSSKRWWTALIVVLSTLFYSVAAVKTQDFKTCDQSGFCKRNRAYADAALSPGTGWSSPYRLSPESITFKNGKLEGTILKTNAQDGRPIRLPLQITFLSSGVARVTLDEERRQKGDIELRHSSQARKQRYNEAGQWALVAGLDVSKDASKEAEKDGITTVRYGPSRSFEAVIQHEPFRLEFKRDGETHVKLNDRGFLNMEHWRPQTEKKSNETGDQKPEDTEDESTWWEETFGGNTDTKPRGPESVGLDISFPDYEHVYGIPMHATPLSLKETRGGAGHYSDPYRMYNTDVFEYEMDSPMTLYGSIPFMQAQRKGSTVGVFWLNGAETWVDIVKSKTSSNPLSLGLMGKTTTQTHWISESGLLDVFVFLGPTPKDVIKSYTELTGYAQLPPYFSIAYHQCRWNYFTDQDVRDVDRRLDRHKIPYDAIWLDIEYTDERKYFTWDPLTFKDPVGMQQQLAERDRKLVAIIDPHIKNVANYYVADELKSKGLAVRNKDGNIYEGWCWPGSSHWVDCFNPAAVEWWASLFKFDRWKGTTKNVFLWNDMNEPSVFNGPEISSPRDNLHYGNWENRDIHNINGMTFVNATYQGLVERIKGEKRRPWVLTRSFYAGSQRLGAMWTGDNQANWEHLGASIPMILSLNIAGFPNAGADVGGFFGNPSRELLTRWYQAGAFYPFFRAHAHIDTRRREPYLPEEPYKTIINQAIRLRYQLLPAWYTAFHEASYQGSPIIRPQYYVFPDDERGFTVDDQFYLGSTGLLIKPVVAEGGTSVDIYLADDEPYYDYFDYTVYQGPGSKAVPAPLEKVPLLMRGGHIIPRRDRVRRSSGLMKWDPYTLVVVVDKNGHAEGTLYVDDGESFDYQEGAMIHRRFIMNLGGSGSGDDINTLRSEDMSNAATSKPRSKSKQATKYLQSMKEVRIEKIILVGNLPAEWANKKSVKVSRHGGGEATKTLPTEVELTYHAPTGNKAAWAVVRDPKLAVAEDWRVNFG